MFGLRNVAALLAVLTLRSLLVRTSAKWYELRRAAPRDMRVRLFARVRRWLRLQRARHAERLAAQIVAEARRPHAFARRGFATRLTRAQRQRRVAALAKGQ